MKIQPISFQGNLANGKKEFEKLSLSEQVVMKSIERFRQKFNENNVNPMLARQGDLAEYVQYLVTIENVVKNKANKIMENVRRNLGI